MNIILSVIKADIGSIGGHLAPFAIGHYVAGHARLAPAAPQSGWQSSIKVFMSVIRAGGEVTS